VTKISFILSYSLFVFFVIFMITLGAPEIVSEEARKEISEITTPEEPPSWASYPIIGHLYTFLKGAYDFLKVFYTLLKFSSGIRWLTVILISPLIITLAYVIIGILRGGT